MKRRFLTVCVILLVLMIYTPAVSARSPAQELTPVLYLPFIANNNDPQVLVNGDFESGHTGWAEISKYFYYLIYQATTIYDVVPHSGTWAAWLGGETSAGDTIQQNVRVPFDKSRLTFYHQIFSEEPTCTQDSASVLVNGIVKAQIPLCIDTFTEPWAFQTVDLSAYSGSLISLEFTLQTGPSSASEWFLDDIGFAAAIP